MHINVSQWRFLALVVALWAAFSFSAHAQSAKCVAVHGALLMPAKAKWDQLAANANVPNDRLIVALFGGEFQSQNGAVDAKVVADVGQRGPFPVLEAAVTFHANDKADLAVTLERGILVLVNAKKSGAAHVQVRASDETFEVSLSEPKSKVAIEIYGRHVPGPPNLNSAREDLPIVNVAFFALVGEAVISTDKHATRLQAPPGPTLYIWDNLTRTPDVHRFETLPDSLKPLTPEERQLVEKIAGFAKAWTVKNEPLVNTIRDAAASKDPLERKAAVVAAGALDDLPGLLAVLNDQVHGDARDMAILAIRHWLGRAPGKSIEMHKHLTTTSGYTPTQAKNLIHLFNGIERDKLRQPETFDLLIQALNHAKMPARELARWHLVRLVPDGKDIKYDAAAPEAARLQSIAEWRRLIPEGQLPPLPKKK